MGHTYITGISQAKIDGMVENIPFKNYSVVMLGGDLTNATTLMIPTLQYTDSIFGLDRAGTLWALGNHDYNNPSLVTGFTNRPLYYSWYYKGISFLVLDTQDSLSNFTGSQLQLIKNVTDTISESSTLILLFHKLVWLYGNPNFDPDTISNGSIGSCFECLNPNNFYADVYPRLVAVKQRNIRVMCIGGDLGYHQRTLHHETADGITFLGSGLHSGQRDNFCIEFSYEESSRTLSWSFENLENVSAFQSNQHSASF